jgi:hypothetical protein
MRIQLVEVLCSRLKALPFFSDPTNLEQFEQIFRVVVDEVFKEYQHRVVSTPSSSRASDVRKVVTPPEELDVEGAQQRRSKRARFSDVESPVHGYSEEPDPYLNSNPPRKDESPTNGLRSSKPFIQNSPAISTTNDFQASNSHTFVSTYQNLPGEEPVAQEAQNYSAAFINPDSGLNQTTHSNFETFHNNNNIDTSGLLNVPPNATSMPHASQATPYNFQIPLTPSTNLIPISYQPNPMANLEANIFFPTFGHTESIENAGIPDRAEDLNSDFSASGLRDYPPVTVPSPIYDQIYAMPPHESPGMDMNMRYFGLG